MLSAQETAALGQESPQPTQSRVTGNWNRRRSQCGPRGSKLEKFKDRECEVQGSRHKGQIETTTTVSHSPNTNLLQSQSTDMSSWQAVLQKSAKYKKFVSHKFLFMPSSEMHSASKEQTALSHDQTLRCFWYSIWLSNQVGLKIAIKSNKLTRNTSF